VVFLDELEHACRHRLAADAGVAETGQLVKHIGQLTYYRATRPV
jgi:hypothetical protein